MCTNVFARMYMYHVHGWCLQSQMKVLDALELDGREPCYLWVLKGMSPLQEQVLSSARLALQPSLLVSRIFCYSSKMCHTHIIWNRKEIP